MCHLCHEKTFPWDEDDYSSHELAMVDPRGMEHPIVKLFLGLIEYPEEHRKLYDCSLGEDNVMSEEWKELVRHFLGLLDGDVGHRLDCGRLDSKLREIAEEHGITLDF